MLQAYVEEGGNEEVRVHIWHRSLKLEGIDDTGLGHDHRFDMTSWVLVGQITHKELLTSPDPHGRWTMYEVVNARKALRETGRRAGEFRLIKESLKVEKHAMTISAGHSYFFPKRTFHESLPDSAVVITIALKTNQEESPARVLSNRGKQPLNAFETSLPLKQRELVLAEAETALRELMAPCLLGLESELIENDPNCSVEKLRGIKELALKLNETGFDVSRHSTSEPGEDSGIQAR